MWKTVAKLFDAAWRNKFGRITIFGRDAETGLWTYLLSADGPAAVTDVEIAWDYCAFDAEKPASAMMYVQRLDDVTRQLTKLGGCDVKASLPANEASRRAAELFALKEKFDQTAVLVLAAPEGKEFSGRDVWDVMLCLGLPWGDMDCFHWANDAGVGDDAFFSVETSTPPGYFFPEAIADGSMNPEDLVFNFSIPRSAEPVKVFDAMARAVQYCQRRMGGRILTTEGAPADLAEARQAVVEIAQKLRVAGLVPGTGAALRLF